MRRTACFLVLSAALAIAGEPAATPSSTAPAVSVQAPPQFGIRADDKSAADAFDGAGVYVTLVNAGSTAAMMGVQAGDRLTSINGQPLAKLDDLKRFLSTTKLGDTLTVELMRKTSDGRTERVTARGTLNQPKAPGAIIQELQDQLAKLRRELDELKAKPRRTLVELLGDLADTAKELKDGLPGAAGQFREQFPNGRFKITFEIDIASDASAADPVKIEARNETKPSKAADPAATKDPAAAKEPTSAKEPAAPPKAEPNKP
jgi:membrane-associated protease RseP (regulator of RpoE activity)